MLLHVVSLCNPSMVYRFEENVGRTQQGIGLWDNFRMKAEPGEPLVLVCLFKRG